ncbi:hypothetical protein [Burkholderia lata]|uniref:hypothetical protein n=1 Tax=Burkholderia lata (strain ATCC 17760 / DSM 23089 / LMG 22485 / NCIMB 9086 / R18194 / 383) TaxID=482957 RepID=UPI001582F1E5|nr:hypothetical protein [Burkholderia lata]
MANELSAGGASGQWIPGRHAYFFDVPGIDSAAALSIASFDAREVIGEPGETRVVLTHPLPLARADYLNRDATFSMRPDGDVSHTFRVLSCVSRR